MYFYYFQIFVGEYIHQCLKLINYSENSSNLINQTYTDIHLFDNVQIYSGLKYVK